MKKKRDMQKEVLSFLERKRARHQAPKLSWHLKCANLGFHPTTQLTHSLTHSGFLFSLPSRLSHSHWHAPEFVLLELSIQKQRQQQQRQQLCVQWLLMKLAARPFICTTSTTVAPQSYRTSSGESVSSEALSWTILLFLLLLFLLLWCWWRFSAWDTPLSSRPAWTK